ncbi:stage II sporulation protein E [Scopulibacillus daqui]|uniref:Stage II sporulation protein E n=1 Tax=Scopulibacillus daqui TaxID=1469162 RepID=A0ABS2Q3D5_9BACL|nr:stage II sporulation protein E [Scopulibacillus daqui]MBM7646450.1 stage II sporulation protein E [Scopulibacillus daqui]
MIQRFESPDSHAIGAYTPAAKQQRRYLQRAILSLKAALVKVFVRWETFCMIIGFLLGRALILSNMSPFIIPFFATVLALKRSKYWLAFVSLMAGGITVSPKHGLFVLMSVIVYIFIRAAAVRFIKKDNLKALPYLVFMSSAAARLAYDFMMTQQWQTSSLFIALVESGLGFILTLIFLQSMPLLSSKVRTKVLKNEEIICFIIMLASVLTGTIGWHLGQVSMEHVFSRYFVLLFSYVGGAAIGSTVGVVVGLILSLANVTSLYQMSLLAFSGLLGGLLKDGRKIGVSLGLVIGTLLIGMYGQGYQQLPSTMIDSLIAAALFLLTPKSVSAKLASYIPGTKEYHAQEQQYSKKLRDVTAHRVEQFSNLFQTLSNSFSPGKFYNEEESYGKEVDMFLSNVTEKTCQTCFKKEYCWVKHFDETYDFMSQIMEQTEEEPVIKDANLNRRWQAHCVKPEKVTQAIFEEQAHFNKHKMLKQKMKESRRLVAEQLMGVSQVMGDFAREIKRESNTHQQQEEEIMINLQEIGLDVENVDIYSLEEGAVDIEMTLPMDCHGECEKVIAPILSDILRENIIVKKKTNDHSNPSGYYQVVFASARAFEIDTGVAHTAKGGGWISGDNFSTFELGAGKFALAISDGMGNGERAYLESNETLKLLSKVLKSGIDETIAIKSINSILSLRTTDEIFSTLDLAMIDLQNASAKFVKIGSNPSFIKRGDKVMIVEASNLPMGILQDFEVDIVGEQLKAGDLLIMMSDGVFEGPKHIENKELWMKRKIRELETDDPQAIADLIMEEVIRTRGGLIEDDMTIVVAKIKHHTPKWAAIPTYTKNNILRRKAQ